MMTLCIWMIGEAFVHQQKRVNRLIQWILYSQGNQLNTPFEKKNNKLTDKKIKIPFNLKNKKYIVSNNRYHHK